jgi:hypothetical protein
MIASSPARTFGCGPVAGTRELYSRATRGNIDVELMVGRKAIAPANV